MRIEKEDKGKLSSFLTSKLSTMCNTDTAILGQYITQLIIEQPDLKGVENECLKQLGDFLRGYTSVFVEELIVFLKRMYGIEEAPKAAPSHAQDRDARVYEDDILSDYKASTSKEPRGTKRTKEYGEEPRKRGRNRLPAKEDPATTFVRVESLTPVLNQWNKLMAHFKKYGFIRCIISDPENGCAYVVYRNHEEALKAIRSPEAFGNNRFVRVVLIYDDDAPSLVHEALEQSKELEEEKAKQKEQRILSQKEEETRRAEAEIERIDADKKKLEQLRETRNQLLQLQSTLVEKVKDDHVSKEEKMDFAKKIAFLSGEIEAKMKEERAIIRARTPGVLAD